MMSAREVHLVRMPRVFTVLAAVAFTFAAAPTAPPAFAQTAQTLAAGQAATITDAGVPLRPPPDGRLQSYGWSVYVDGVGFAASIPGLAAAPGAELVVLHLTTVADDGIVDEAFLANNHVSLAVRSGDVSAPLAVQLDWNFYSKPDDEYFAAAVPKSGPADLILSVGSLLPQTFDLRAAHRVGTVPAVLYRDASQPDVIVKPTAVSSFSASSAAGSVTGQFGVAEASLQDWQPFSTTLSPSPDQAYLDVEFARSQMSVPGYSTDRVGPAQALPAGAVTFVLSNGQTVTATNSLDPTQLFDIFSGDFYALVPADITSAKVIVTPGVLPIQIPAADGYDSQQIPISFAAPLTQSINFPAPWPPAASTNASSPPASSAAAIPRSHHGSGSGFPWPLILAAVAVVAVLAVVGLARRRRLVLTVTPVSWPPPRLSPAATAVLAPIRRALPPGEPNPIGDDTVEHPLDQPVSGIRPVVVILLLGPLQVEGLTKRIGRRSVIRLLVVLAVTPERPMGGDELAMAISARPTRDPRVESLQSYASVLRAGLPAGMLPDADADGYHLDHSRVSVDWLALAAVANESPDAPGWAERAAGALEPVRGRPLEGSRWEGIEPVARSMEATIESLARRLAGRLLESGDPVGAERAVTQGLKGVPGAVSLWQARLEAAAAGSGYGLERAWVDAQSALGADSALIATDYQRLRRQIADRPSANT